jgi:hypothetical protein
MPSSSLPSEPTITKPHSPVLMSSTIPLLSDENDPEENMAMQEFVRVLRALHTVGVVISANFISGDNPENYDVSESVR